MYIFLPGKGFFLSEKLFQIVKDLFFFLTLCVDYHCHTRSEVILTALRLIFVAEYSRKCA